MAGLVPAIHVFGAATKNDVDARHKAGMTSHWLGPLVFPASVGNRRQRAMNNAISSARLETSKAR